MINGKGASSNNWSSSENNFFFLSMIQIQGYNTKAKILKYNYVPNNID